MARPLKVLYAAFRHDPTDPSSSSGALYFCYQSLVEAGLEVRICGPFQQPPLFVERVFRRCYTKWTGTRYLKYQLSIVRRMSNALHAMQSEWKPDVVFSIYPPCLAVYKGSSPCVFDQDVSFIDYQKNYPEFGSLAFRISLAMERKAFSKSCRVITHSQHARECLEKDYKVESKSIEVFPYPPVLPGDVLKRHFTDPLKPIGTPVQLLLVGREYHRKGVDIAIQVVTQLNQRGLSAELTICGLEDIVAPHVNCVGVFRKTDPAQLESYTDLYRRAHLLIHPTRFDPSPLVPSEAAAFGVPTITNDSGGMATTVADGVSGIVLPRASPAEAYVAEITNLAQNPSRYLRLRQSTRQRYEKELNWDVNAKHVARIVKEAARLRQRGD